MNTETTPELIYPDNQWIVRTQTMRKMNRKTDMPSNEERVELIWGRRELKRGKNDVEMTYIVGDVYHELTGPTALKSITEMAARMNQRGEKPPAKTPKTVADGFKQTFEQGGGNALFDCVTLKSTISYKPDAKRI